MRFPIAQLFVLILILAIIGDLGVCYSVHDVDRRRHLWVKPRDLDVNKEEHHREEKQDVPSGENVMLVTFVIMRYGVMIKLT